MNGKLTWLQRVRLEELLWQASRDELDADELLELARLSFDCCPDLLDELRADALGLANGGA